ncbi:MAG: 2-oxoacid:acceptor oxidoreductase subunit alpha [bacterium]|jgi:2-oxoglutarate ferredoxin oxidoreductase subunit alpha|nr:2-oxoacid:acceptor oxidoreductase subunit alpha [bacterium]
MKTNPTGVNTGIHFMDGDSACCEGALAAGCRFVAGYPITPSTEVVELMAKRLPHIGGMFIQMEDELASSIAILGAAWAGAKTMTVTSGPGFSLMMEHIGYAIMTETPCVIVDVQRGGPSTGLPTMPGQGDMMQVRWGSHGDYEVIALAPNSPQECFDLTIQCFNFSEKYRTPVFLMMDECVGHMMEKVEIPTAQSIEVESRRLTTKKPGDFYPYQEMVGMVPRMTKTGLGHNIHVTGLTHDERGYPAMSSKVHQELVGRLIHKIRDNVEDISLTEEHYLDDAEVIVISYGISSRVAIAAVEKARAKGQKVGFLRLITVWPFPEKKIQDLAARVKGFVIAEMNQGQMMRELERCIAGQASVHGVLNYGGNVLEPDAILKKIEGAFHD